MSQHLDYEKKKELILGFNRNPVAFGVERVNTVSFQDPKVLLASLTWDVVCKTRMAMEEDKSIVHPILYMLVVDSTGKRFLKYKRGANGTEERLRNHSCGFGGHVDIIDFQYTRKGVLDPVETVRKSGYRELLEELKFQAPALPDGIEAPVGLFGMMHEVGVIYEPDDEVGNTHLAIVAVFQIADGVTIASGEDDIEAPQWLEFDSPEVDTLTWENWSRYILENKADILEAFANDLPLSYTELVKNYHSFKGMEKAIATA